MPNPGLAATHGADGGAGSGLYRPNQDPLGAGAGRRLLLSTVALR